MSATQAGLDTIMSIKDGRSFRWAYFIPNGCALKTIAKMIDKKQINPVIEKVYMFDETPEAYRRLLKGHARGKVVINVMSAENESMDQKKESNTIKQNQNV
ncbi:reticulon-4-interacting protein 1 homolog, mitochondrial-like [Stegodyphus dumicola]|uniref:reticulon-4-interacting protein 1 homolog, mitochondrial-like n=1 Tax=Stegodyphus dumicola TaxID=202533 RepID=UPI0015B09E97|nr:reticulon-4-interacting protein 1 homolog, mitochondrial-like [Stegodyphus dumicola]